MRTERASLERVSVGWSRRICSASPQSDAPLGQTPPAALAVLTGGDLIERRVSERGGGRAVRAELTDQSVSNEGGVLYEEQSGGRCVM